ncbi:hypothetical protein CQ14_30965 [Bradyrhizobium lablabi]|uniref:Uncharacterized protein n=1 Tax=Bradyrhizobium lablabi TaxID=722472 RepID=A0A0R3MR98_9BRAD|nr:hypothetical protein CQ14_30965 [Bradyrhizobium lablabi]
MIGRSAVGPGPAQAIPFSQLLASMLTSPLTVSQVNVNSIVYAGSTSGTATVSAQAVAGTPTIKWPTTSGTVATNATSPVVLNATTGNISCPTCVTNDAVVGATASRALAATLNLSAQSVVQTLGYATAGDGGGATYKNVGSTVFQDARIASAVIATPGSGYVNGTYRGVNLSGGTGTNAIATVVVSGGFVSSVTLTGATAVGYTPGDVLTASNSLLGGSGSGFTYTVSTVASPTCSFTDSVGTHFQIVFPAAGLDARSCGVKFDWDGSDGSASDNFTALQNALSFAGSTTSTIVDLGGSIGGQVLLPKKTAMFCGGGATPLIVPYGVKIKGQGNYTSVLKPCDTWNVATNVIEICDKETHLACFGALLEDLQIFMQRDVTSNAGVSLVYSNNAQHESGLRRVVLYPGACRRAVTLESGFGGATYVVLESVEAKGGKKAASCGGNQNGMIVIAYGTTQVRIKDLVIGGLSASFNGPRDLGLVVTGGFINMDGFHPEQIVTPATINIPGGLANGQIRVFNAIGGVDCVGLFTLVSGNTAGNFMLSPPNALNGCTRLVTNGQAGGANLTGPVMTDTIFNP